jgi:hypothetical protein
VALVVDPVAAARGWALQLLLDAPDRSEEEPPSAPAWVQDHAPWLARFWGDGLKKAKKLTLNETILDWSRTDPEGLLAAAKWIAARRPASDDENAQRLMNEILMTADSSPQNLAFRNDLLDQLLGEHAQALVDAVQILNARRDDVVKVLTRFNYTDPQSIGGYLDQDLPTSAAPISSGG